MRRNLTDPKDRVRSVALVLLIHVALGYALVSSLGYTVVPRPADALKLFDLADQPPPPPPMVPRPPPRQPRPADKAKEAEGAAAPPALRNTPTEATAPKPRIPLPSPPAAEVPAEGTATAAGAALNPGPGTGRGGTGNGLGSGLSGNGTGGGGGGLGSPARQIEGDISDRDYPVSAINARAQGTTYFRFTVGVDGRVGACGITRSSGSRALDARTCDLARSRFRFRPATNRAGQPIAVTIEGEQEWALGPDIELPPIDGQR